MVINLILTEDMEDKLPEKTDVKEFFSHITVNINPEPEDEMDLNKNFEFDEYNSDYSWLYSYVNQTISGLQCCVEGPEKNIMKWLKLFDKVVVVLNGEYIIIETKDLPNDGKFLTEIDIKEAEDINGFVEE